MWCLYWSYLNDVELADMLNERCYRIVLSRIQIARSCPATFLCYFLDSNLVYLSQYDFSKYETALKIWCCYCSAWILYHSETCVLCWEGDAVSRV